jgi:hypothetical protein
MIRGRAGGPHFIGKPNCQVAPANYSLEDAVQIRHEVLVAKHAVGCVPVMS